MVAVEQLGEMGVSGLQRMNRVVHFRKLVVEVVMIHLHVVLPLRLVRCHQRQKT